MATVTSTADITTAAQNNRSIPLISWAGIVTGDTVTAKLMPAQNGVASYVQFKGTFAGGTVAKLQASNDGTTFFDMKDFNGATITCTSAAAFEFSSSAAWFRPSVASGAADSITVLIACRG